MTLESALTECTELVLCKGELFMQADIGTIYTVYPCALEIAQLLSKHYGKPLTIA